MVQSGCARFGLWMLEVEADLHSSSVKVVYDQPTFLLFLDCVKDNLSCSFTGRLCTHQGQTILSLLSTGKHWHTPPTP
jgi:hypothetical protein